MPKLTVLRTEDIPPPSSMRSPALLKIREMPWALLVTHLKQKVLQSRVRIVEECRR
jgi:hypothetical protein